MRVGCFHVNHNRVYSAHFRRPEWFNFGIDFRCWFFLRTPKVPLWTFQNATEPKISIYPKTPPARTSAWLDNVSAIVSSLYMATGVLYCLFPMLRTGEAGICWNGTNEFNKNILDWEIYQTNKWPSCRIVSTAKIAYLLLVGSKWCLCDGCVASWKWRWGSGSNWRNWWLPCGTSAVKIDFKVNYSNRTSDRCYQPLYDQFERWSSLDDGILSVLVAQGVQVCWVDANNSISSLKPSFISNTSCINLLKGTKIMTQLVSIDSGSCVTITSDDQAQAVQHSRVCNHNFHVTHIGFVSR